MRTHQIRKSDFFFRVIAMQLLRRGRPCQSIFVQGISYVYLFVIYLLCLRPTLHNHRARIRCSAQRTDGMVCYQSSNVSMSHTIAQKLCTASEPIAIIKSSAGYQT